MLFLGSKYAKIAFAARALPRTQLGEFKHFLRLPTSKGKGGQGGEGRGDEWKVKRGKRREGERGREREGRDTVYTDWPGL